jgi:hypothetical protein
MPKPIVTVRGTRILVTPSADAELPPAERREFRFLNPSVTAYPRLIDAHLKVDDAGQPALAMQPLLNRMLRGWSNVRTDDAEIANKYGVELPADGAEVQIPSPESSDARAATDLFDVLTLAEWQEIAPAVIDTISPARSGN